MGNNYIESETVKNNITIGFRRISDIGEQVKKPTEFEGIEQYLCLNMGNKCFGISEETLDSLDISVEEAWQKAEQNVRKRATFTPLNTVLAKGFEENGVEIPEELWGTGDPMDFAVVVSNTSKCNGASSILCKDRLFEYERKIGIDKIVLIPASVHEFLVIPYTEGTDIETYNTMVREVNEAELMENEVLSDRVYIIDVE